MLPQSPLVTFTLLIAVILILPPLFERLKLPGLVGLLVAGIVLGPGGLNLLNSKIETVKLLSEIGKIYLMFVAGLEIDLADFRKKRNRSLAFGVSTFTVPMITGTLIGRLFGFGWNSSILIGSLLASHTLLGYPIVQRLGLVKNEAVAVTIGATIITDISALLVLAICTSIHAGEFTAASLALQLISLALYSALILFGLDWAGKKYFSRTGDDEGNQFMFILVALFLAAVGAQVIEVENIIGAFLAGLAVNDVVGNSPVKEKVVFVGSTLFIPCFFVDMGLLLNISTFIQTLATSLLFTIVIVGGLIGSKFLAALVLKFPFRYQWSEIMTMWSLSMPQVAATLAATVVGYQVGLLNETVLNSVIVMMLVTSVLGPLLTERFARKLPQPEFSLELPAGESCDVAVRDRSIWWENREQGVHGEFEAHGQKRQYPFTVLVPIVNPQTQRYLIETAALLACHEGGRIIPLAIARAHLHMDEPILETALQQSQHLLDQAVSVAQEFNAPVKPKLRIDDEIAEGITRTAREQNASLIIMGWSKTTGLRARLFGNLIDTVFWSSHCPVSVMRLLKEPMNIHRVLVPVKNLSPQALRAVRFGQLFADANQAELKLLHICDRHTPKDQIAQFEEDLMGVVSQPLFQTVPRIKTLTDDDPAKGILREAKFADLLVMRASRRRTVGGLAVGDITLQVLKAYGGSLVLFGEPYS